MRIDRLDLKNFKKFEAASFEFPQPLNSPHPNGSFHVFIGENGVGKTSVLDALAVALGVWLERVPDSLLLNSRRRLTPDLKRLVSIGAGDRSQLQQAPEEMSIQATGSILGQKPVVWKQALGVGKKNSSNRESKAALSLIDDAFNRIQYGEQVLLPVIAYYGAGRAWLPHNQRKQLKARNAMPSNRWEAFYDCLNERIRVSDLNGWFRSEAIERGNRGGLYRPGFEIVLKAVLRVIPGADGLRYDSDREEIVLSIDGNAQPFSNLSAGQRNMFALVADIAVKMVTQNNYLVPSHSLTTDDQPLPKVLKESPGVVLIDELDVHLHPKWQRSVVQALRDTFPEIQFITTTHSAFIVQSLKEEELINLQGQTVPELGNLGVEEIAEGLMGVERADVSERYSEMVGVAKDYLQTLDEAAASSPDKQALYKEKLATNIAPYADNPAFQAFLELKQAAKLGPDPNGHH
jgi:predicted ATP-binding protein involved in virulence